MAKKKAAKKATKKPAKAEVKAKATKKTAKKEDATTEDKGVKKKRKTRNKKTVELRRKLFWGVFNHAMKRVALYEFSQRKAADKRAKELSPEGKPPHFVQKVKEDVVEEKDELDIDAGEVKVVKKKKKSAKH